MPETQDIPLSTRPAATLSALQQAVYAKSRWRILTPANSDPSRFVIETPVSYPLMRGWSMTAVYRIIGQVQPDGSQAAALTYRVETPYGVALFHAGLHVGTLLVMTLILGIAIFSPPMPRTWVSIALVGLLLLTTLAYAIYAYRRHQQYDEDLHQFMRGVIQHLQQTDG